MNQRTYLDHNATAPLRAEVRDGVVAALSLVGNPSSVHAEGRAARAAIEEARAKVAALVGARAQDVIFTSGGTEANAMALAAPFEDSGQQTYVSAIEHPSVLAGALNRPKTTTIIPVTQDGVADLDALAAMLAPDRQEATRPFVSLMAANNETGAIQPIGEAARIVHEAGGILHSDAVQIAGRVRLDMGSFGADMVSLSAHKIGGPKGVGALVLAEGAEIAPLMIGGGQEGRRRPGTENVAAIVGFGVAAELAMAELSRMDRVARLRDELEMGVLALDADAFVFSRNAPRLPNTSCVVIPGLKAETVVIALDLAGIAVSAGSACSSGKVETSHVAAAMGVAPEIAQGAIRVSLGFVSTNNDIQTFLGAFGELAGRLTKDARKAA